MDNFDIWDLKDIVTSITQHHQEITELYLFGSRAYGTNSYRSDIDILAITDGTPISDAKVNEWLHEEYCAVDLFTSYDKLVAKSCINGSSISYRNHDERGYTNLIDQLDAKKLWDKDAGFSNEFTEWEQKTIADTKFKMSIIPSVQDESIAETIATVLSKLERENIKTYFAGSNYFEIANSIVTIIEDTFNKPTKYQRKAHNFSFDKILIANEYDFQNLIHLLIRPLFPDIESENCTITIDGNNKVADFGLHNNKIIIEAKWVDTVSKKNEVVKTIAGLSNFYAENPNVKSLIFVVLYDESVTIDENCLKYRFSYEKSSPSIIVRFIKNTYKT